MKIELTSRLGAGEAPRADGRGEAHIRVLTNEPRGPEVWPEVQTRISEHWPWFFEEYEQWKPGEGWFPELTDLEEGEDSYDGYGFESWFVLTEKRK